MGEVTNRTNGVRPCAVSVTRSGLSGRWFEKDIARQNDMPLYRPREFDEAYRWCSHLANASEASPATASFPFWPLEVSVRPRRPVSSTFSIWGFLLVFYGNHSLYHCTT